MSQTLDFRKFCVELISTGDLDPVYIGVVDAEMAPIRLRRWLLAYGLFYHVGVAGYMAQFGGDEFWNVLAIAARNEATAPTGGRWPRSSERRHFRGEFAVDCVASLRQQYGGRPEDFINRIVEAAPDVVKVREAVERNRGFGGWASFKFADLVDRVVGITVHFDLKTAMYDTPIAGAKLVWEQHRSSPCPNVDAAVELSQQIFEEATAGLTAPPLHDRKLSFNELETCLCKYKSHVAGRYPIGKDIKECRHAAHEWSPYSPLAAKMAVKFLDMENSL